MDKYNTMFFSFIFCSAARNVLDLLWYCDGMFFVSVNNSSCSNHKKKKHNWVGRFVMKFWWKPYELYGISKHDRDRRAQISIKFHSSVLPSLSPKTVAAHPRAVMYFFFIHLFSVNYFSFQLGHVISVSECDLGSTGGRDDGVKHYEDRTVYAWRAVESNRNPADIESKKKKKEEK